MAEESSSAMSDESTSDRSTLPLTWPAGSDTGVRKQEVLAELRERPPNPELAIVARRALSIETSSELVTGLMCALARHEGNETVADDGAHWYSGLGDVYTIALKDAGDMNVRIALHRGFAAFHPRGSTDGFASAANASLLEAEFRSSTNDDERSVLAQILGNRTQLSSARLLDTVAARVDDERCRLSSALLTLWVQLHTKAYSSEWERDRHREEASRRLSAALPRAETSGVLAKALEHLSDEFYSHECDDVFIAHLTHSDPQVRQAATLALSHLEKRGEELASDVLRRDGDYLTLDAAWRVLASAGMDERSLLQLVARNPNAESAARFIFNRSNDGGRRSQSFRAIWPLLPPAIRDGLRELSRSDEFRHHRRFGPPFFEDWYFDADREIRERHSPGLRALAVSILNEGVNDSFDTYDFDTVTGLRCTTAVEFKVVDALRFQFLLDSRSREGVPLADIFSSRDFDLAGLAELERAYDRECEQLSAVRKEIADLSREMGLEVILSIREASLSDSRAELREARRGSGRKSFERFHRLAPRFIEMEKRYAILYDRVSLQGETSYWRLHNATHQFLPLLREVGCSFDHLLYPDGVFGEYDHRDQTITIYAPMIEMASMEAAQVTGAALDEVQTHIRTIVDLHELAHAHMHLGADASGHGWQNPGVASRAFHEAIAQSYTRRLVKGLDVPGLGTVLDVMEAWLPHEYRLADHLDVAEPEELRAFVVLRRQIPPSRTLLDVARAVILAMPGYIAMVEVRLGHSDSRAASLRGPFDAFAAAARNTETAAGMEVPRVLARLIETAGLLPQAALLLGAFVPGGWPSSADLRWLEFEALAEGNPVGDGRLRIIRRDDFVAAVNASRSSDYVGLLPAIRESRIAVEKLLALAGRESDDEFFGPLIPPHKSSTTSGRKNSRSRRTAR